ncbi:MAG: hypothetical protein DI589_04300 [Shinella sp.]|nr:MAG: hypothetical protein DI589_04300 [Shinella sp.]
MTWRNFEQDRYSRQIASGFQYLAFEPELEAEYRDAVIDEQRGAARICAMFGLIVWTGFALLDFKRLSDANLWNHIDWQVRLWLGGRWTIWLVLLIGILKARNPRFHYDALYWFGYVAIGAVAATTAHIARLKGVIAVDSSLIVVVVAAFMPLGFTFYRAVAGAMIVAFIGTTFLLSGSDLRPGPERLQLAAILLMAIPVAAIGGFLRERSARFNFLLQRKAALEATTDPLTGLPNRRWLAAHADTVLRQAARNADDVVVAMVDIDHFKKFNDRYGHMEGDAVIRLVGRSLAEIARRPMDIVARTGGEEFCVLLYKTTKDAGHKLFCEALERLSDTRIAHEGSPHTLLTASIGATHHKGHATLDDLMARADKALYTAKVQGRAQIIWSA